MTTLDEMDRMWWDDRVEAYVDNDLSAEETARFEQYAVMDETLGRELEMARQISSGLGGLPAVECPDHVTDHVMATIRREMAEDAWSYLKALVREVLLPRLRPTLAMAILVFVVLTSALLGGRTTAPDSEVTQALSEVRWTMAYLSDLGRQTGATVRKEALEPLVVVGMHRAVDTFIEN